MTSGKVTKEAFMRPATTYSQVLGQVVEAYRKSAGMTQETLATQLGLSQSAYSRLERGETPFTMPQVRKLSIALGAAPATVIQVADKGVVELKSRGVTVLDDKPKVESNAWLWIAGSVLGAIIAVVVLGEGGKK
jgi:transcriptional regulator with XRE-family HTH domain